MCLRIMKGDLHCKNSFRRRRGQKETNYVNASCLARKSGKSQRQGEGFKAQFNEYMCVPYEPKGLQCWCRLLYVRKILKRKTLASDIFQVHEQVLVTFVPEVYNE